MTEPLRLLVFDRTCVGPRFRPGLRDAWAAGGMLYRGLGRIDGVLGAETWDQALDWLVESSQAAGRPLGEVQYWGHGRRGLALIAGDVLDATSLHEGSARRARLRAVCNSFAPHVPGTGGFWFRTCETLGGQVGHTFARAWTDLFGHRIGGHTHVIGFWQSGLHSLEPGAAPTWSPQEGVRDPTAPTAAALDSGPGLPHTIHCLQGRIPRGW